MSERESSYCNRHKKRLSSYVLIIKILAISVLLLLIVSCSFSNRGQSNAEITLTKISKDNGQTSPDVPQGNTATIAQEGAIPQDTEKLKKINAQLLEEAQREQIKVNDSEIENTIKSNLDQFGISNEQLDTELKKAGLTYDEFKEKVKAQMEISTLINSKVNLSQITVSDDEINKYIDDNKQDFQDFLQNEQNLAILKAKVKSLLLKQKQTNAVLSYAESLSK